MPKKVDDLFLVVALTQDHLNIPPTLSHPAKTVLKIYLKTGWGALRVPGGALTHFSCKLGLNKKFFHRPGSVGAPTAPLATPMGTIYRLPSYLPQQWRH